VVGQAKLESCDLPRPDSFRSRQVQLYMNLILVCMTDVLGIYGSSKSDFPKSMSYLAPDAAQAYINICHINRLRISDMYRSPEQSLIARQTKSGVQPPGFSAHNFGVAIDVDVDDCLSRFKKSKPQFDSLMEGFGWYCHRKDGKRGFEDWHYNFLGDMKSDPTIKSKFESGSTTADAVEEKIRLMYGSHFTLTSKQIQSELSKLKLYSGDIDGIIGPRTRMAVSIFQKTWGLKESGEADERTMRTLVTVAADKHVISSASTLTHPVG